MHRAGRVVALVSAFVTLAVAPAADWPQWRGPNRSDVSAETGLLKQWPKDGPRLAWTFTDAGLGYCGPAVVGQRLYCAGSEVDADKEYLFCIDTATGKQVWRTPFKKMSTKTRVGPQWGAGPRSTPTVDGEAVYVLGVTGDLVCVDAATGALRWQKNLVADYGGRVMSGWGWCESVLVDGDALICCPGYENGSVAALDKKTGEVKWRSKDLTDDASYASVVPATIAGVKQYVVKTKDHMAGVAAADGRLLWKEKVGVNPTAVIPTPIVKGDAVFTTCGYRDRGGSCGLVKLAGTGGTIKSEVAWKDANLFNHHGGVVLVGDHLYGHSDGDRRNNKPAGWSCVEFATGKEVWTSSKLDKGSVTSAGGQLYCWGENTGNVVLVDASSAGWTEHGRFTPPQKSKRRAPSGKAWTHPVVANGKLYIRDQDLLFCYDVSADGSRAAK